MPAHIQGLEPDGQIYFDRSTIFCKIVAACDLIRLVRQEQGAVLWFVHNGTTVMVDANSKPDQLFCAWLESRRTGATQVGPAVDPLVVERLVQFLSQRSE